MTRQQQHIKLSNKKLDEILSYNTNFDTFDFEDRNNSKQLSRDFVNESVNYFKQTIYNDVKLNYPQATFETITAEMIDKTYKLLGLNWFFAVQTNHGMLYINEINKPVEYKGKDPHFNIKNDPISDEGYLTLLDNLSYEMDLLTPENYKENIHFILKLYKDGLAKSYKKYTVIRKLNPSHIYTIKSYIVKKLNAKGIKENQITPMLIVQNFKNIKKEYIKDLGKSVDNIFYIELFASAMQHQGLQPVTQEHVGINIEELLE